MIGLVLWVISVISNIVGESLFWGNEGCGGFISEHLGYTERGAGLVGLWGWMEKKEGMNIVCGCARISKGKKRMDRGLGD